MMSRVQAFSYKAVGPDGKTRKGVISAGSEADAYTRLRADNLSPIKIQSSAATGASASWSQMLAPLFGTRLEVLSDAALEETFSSLAVLLRAGADIRTALSVLSHDSTALRVVTQSILGGASVESGFAGVIPTAHAHLRGLIAAGEARGDLAAGLEAAASVLATRRKIRQQLFDALSYPAFVFTTAIAALCVILMVVVPAIAPLLSDTGHDLPVYFRIILGLSEGLQAGWVYILCGLGLGAFLIWFGWRYGTLRDWFDVWLLKGPVGAIARALVFGGFARTLGDSLQSGASLTEALRLCQRGVGNAEARQRLDILVTQVRQGRRLSEALRQVDGFPAAIIRLCEVGEASGAVGAMLAKGGAREETQSLAQIDKLSKLLGPALIMLLGALIGGLMGGVLTALTDIGGMAGV